MANRTKSGLPLKKRKKRTVIPTQQREIVKKASNIKAY